MEKEVKIKMENKNEMKEKKSRAKKSGEATGGKLMKSPIYKTKLYLLIAITVSVLISVGCPISKKGGDRHKPITQKLIDLLDKNPEIRNMLEKSIAEAKKVNPDRKTNPVQSLSEYFDFIDKVSEQLPHDILDDQSGSVFDQVDQGLDYFYFLINQPLPELEGKGFWGNAIQFYPPFSSWLRDFANSWREFLDSERSWNDEIYKKFYDDPRFGLQKGWYEDPSNWKTWNQFFSRRLKSPDMRPVASPDDPSVVISPADSVPQGVWQIDKDSNIKADGGLKVKNDIYYNIRDLLGKDSLYRDAFANGILTHTFLNVHDYHRYHFAVGGTVKEKGIIPGNLADFVVWDPEQKKYIDLTASIGWQFTQTRGYVVVDTGKYGLVALIPVGMSLISSVNFEDNVKVGTTYRKGDMLGYFLFGGSDFIMLFQEKAGFEITAPREDESSYKHILMGEEYGVLKGSRQGK
jgi:phosphatidylserine decarboxylase precursor